MYFAKKNEHTIPLFINAKLLPLNFLYYKTLSELMHDVSTASAPVNIRNLFTKVSSVHSYNTRSSTSDNFDIKASRLEIQKNGFSRIGAKLWNEIPSSPRKLPKKSFKLRIKIKLLSVLEDEDSFTEVRRIISKLNENDSTSSKTNKQKILSIKSHSFPTFLCISFTFFLTFYCLSQFINNNSNESTVINHL